MIDLELYKLRLVTKIRYYVGLEKVSLWRDSEQGDHLVGEWEMPVAGLVCVLDLLRAIVRKEFVRKPDDQTDTIKIYRRADKLSE
ncbi:MAG TPA: hypothetical protein VMX18_02190 [Candidatus Bipolaricaulota bacterium]|nr:hypothetical protein [Candidatus Bipolaricaulota bacterium]